MIDYEVYVAQSIQKNTISVHCTSNSYLIASVSCNEYSDSYCTACIGMHQIRRVICDLLA